MADRGFSSTIETALSSADVALALAVYMNWPSGAVRMWTGNGSISYSANTWVGAGEIGNIDKIADSVDKSDLGVELTLNYLDDDLRNEINTTNPVGRDASIYLWLMNTSTAQVTDSYEIFTGFVDKIDIYDAGNTGAITVRLASELAYLQRARFFTLSDAHQKFLFSGDKGCEFATKMDEVIYWGRKPVTPIISYPNPGGYDNWGPPPGSGPVLP